MNLKYLLLSSLRLVPLLVFLGISEAQNNEIELLSKRVEQIEQEMSGKVVVDLTRYIDHSDFGILQAYFGKSGEPLKVQNSVSWGENGHLERHYFFDEEGKVFAGVSDSLSNFPDGSQKFVSETTFYDAGAYLGSFTREGSFKKGEEFALEKLAPKTVVEYDPGAEEAANLFDAENETAQQIRVLVKALANYQGDLPEKLLLDTISPNGRFLVSWNEIDPGEGTCGFQLYDLEKKANLVELPKGRTPGGNHVYHSSNWSKKSDFFVFINEIKWSTESAPIVQVDSKSGAAKVVGDLYESAGNHAWTELKRAKHPFTKDREGIHGFVQIESIHADGSVDLVFDSQSKFEGPENNVRTAMSIKYSGEGAAVSGFAILGEDEKPVFSKPTGFMISSNKFGPITRETPFNLNAIRALFPNHEVVAGSETFEEGGETPVILIRADEEIIITIVPVRDEARIGNVYTSSPGIPTQFGIAVGSRFGEVFSKIGKDVGLEGMTGDVVTGLPGIPNVSLRFLPKDLSAEIGDLPPFRQLKDWKLHTIEWYPGQ